MTASSEFIAKETDISRQPIEIYDIYRDTTHFRHTSGDVEVLYNGYTWSPATIYRDSVKYNNDMKSTEVNIAFAKTNPAISQYIANTPIQLAWVEIYKLFRDQDPYETQLVFKGQIFRIALKGAIAQATCYGVEKALENQLNKWYYQVECNHTLFDEWCALTEAAYQVTTAITLDSSLTLLSSSSFGAYADDYFTLGNVYFNGDYRQITSHTGNQITIMYPFSDLEDSNTVIAVPGCDGNVETCISKFSNIIHFLGFPNTPIDNPCTWVNR